MKMAVLLFLMCFLCFFVNFLADAAIIMPDYNLAETHSFQPVTSYYRGEKEVEEIQQQRLENQMLALKIQQEKMQLQQEQEKVRFQNNQMYQACCASHGGTLGCDTNTHYLLCADNTEPSSCVCE